MVVYEVVFSLVAIITIVLWRQVSVVVKIAYAYGYNKAVELGVFGDWQGTRAELDEFCFQEF